MRITVKHRDTEVTIEGMSSVGPQFSKDCDGLIRVLNETVTEVLKIEKSLS